MLLLEMRLHLHVRAASLVTGGQPFSLLRLLSTTTTTTTSSSSSTPDHFAIDDYLIRTCHLSPAQALKSSKHVAHLKAPTKPDAVLAFLADLGLSVTDITAAIAVNPRLLCANVEKTLAPRAAVLRDLGFSPPQIARLVALAGTAFHGGDLGAKLRFWLPYFGSIDKLLEALEKNFFLLSSSLERVVGPNVSLLQQCGLSACDIAKLLVSNPRLLTAKPEFLQAVVCRAEELGVPRGSAMFRLAIRAISCLASKTAAARRQFLTTLGWSDAEVAMAVSKMPSLLTRSEERLRRAVQFLTVEAKLDLGYIARRPALLGYSLDQRLAPRHYVMKVLKAKGLPKGDLDFYSAATINEKSFLDKFVLPHKERIPGLADAYAAACAGKVPAEVAL